MWSSYIFTEFLDCYVNNRQQGDKRRSPKTYCNIQVCDGDLQGQGDGGESGEKWLCSRWILKIEPTGLSDGLDEI